MAPGTRRANRGGYAEHDDFEGLPVRQWRQDWTTVAPPEPQETQHHNDIWDIELIHGMPRDATLLPPHTQELLRAARSGRLYKRPAPLEEDDAEPETTVQDKVEKKEDDASTKGFSIKLWKQVPRNVEASTVSHLAKRRKGTIQIASKTIQDKGPTQTVTRATVRRVDAAGNPYTEDVTLAEGQTVQGEIISMRVEAVGGGALAVPPPRRRMPPPKRKKAGPGRGRKKGMKLPLPGPGQPVAPVTGADGVVKTEGAENGVKTEGQEHANQDTEMADGDGDGDDGDDNDNDDDDEDGDDDDEGDEGDEDSRLDDTRQNSLLPDESDIRDRDMTDAMDVTPAVEEPEPTEAADKMDTDPPEDTTSHRSTPPKPLNLAPPLASPRLEGSPLKNVVLPSPTEGRPPLDLAAELAKKAEAEERLEDASMVAKPPSEIVGEAPDDALERDIPPPQPKPQLEEALLPPPPDQVGNISSPRGSPKESGQSFDAIKQEIQPGEDALSGKPGLSYQESVGDDTIKPDDSASVKMADSTAVSEAATASVGGVVDAIPPAEPPVEPTTDKEGSAPAPADEETTNDEGPDLMKSLMGELDRESSKEKEKTQGEDAPKPAEEPAEPEGAKEPSAEPTTEPAPAAASEPKGSPEAKAEDTPNPDLQTVPSPKKDSVGPEPVPEPQSESDKPAEAPVDEAKKSASPPTEEKEK